MHKLTSTLTAARVLILFLLIGIPSFLLFISWRRVFPRIQSDRWTSGAGDWLLILTTASFLWLILIMVWPLSFPPPYSAGRFLVIYANLASTAAIAVGTLFTKYSSKRSLIGAASAVALDWLFVLVVNSAI